MPGALLVGPDTGGRDPEPWLRALLPLLPAGTLHAVTHHVYPGARRGNFNTPQLLDSTLPEIAWYTDVVTSLAPTAQIWAGENGPIGGGDDGTCGAASVCGTFASAIWYADDMALRARHGFVQHQRQDLFGGAYGLTSSVTGAMALTRDEPVLLRPDFWINFLWKRTLGISVLAAASSSAAVRAYAFGGAAPSPYAAARTDCGGTLALLLVNLDNASSVDVALPPPEGGGGGAQYAAWLLTPAPGEGAFSAAAALNGAPLPPAVDAAHSDPAAFLRHIVQPPVRAAVAAGATLPPLSATFLCYS